MLWYTREASVAVYVANLPGIWPLLREHIRILRDHTNSYVTGQSQGPRYGYGSQYGNISKAPRSRVRTFTNLESDEVELDTAYNKSGAASAHSTDKPHSSNNPFSNTSQRQSLESDERALNEGTNDWKGMSVLEVQVDTKVEIKRDDWNGSNDQALSNVVKIEGPHTQQGPRK